MPAGTWHSGTPVLGQLSWTKLNEATDLFTHNFPYPYAQGEQKSLFWTKLNKATDLRTIFHIPTLRGNRKVFQNFIRMPTGAISTPVVCYIIYQRRLRDLHVCGINLWKKVWALVGFSLSQRWKSDALEREIRGFTICLFPAFLVCFV
jgi:hypothetical protein